MPDFRCGKRRAYISGYLRKHSGFFIRVRVNIGSRLDKMQDPSWRAEIPISQPAIHKPFPPYRLRRVFQDLGAFDHLANPTSAPDPLLFASQDQARSCGSSSGFVGGDFSRDHVRCTASSPAILHQSAWFHLQRRRDRLLASASVLV